jgi:hypothetical protein
MEGWDVGTCEGQIGKLSPKEKYTSTFGNREGESQGGGKIEVIAVAHFSYDA